VIRSPVEPPGKPHPLFGWVVAAIFVAMCFFAGAWAVERQRADCLQAAIEEDAPEMARDCVR
jgi:hypothetical protein